MATPVPSPGADPEFDADYLAWRDEQLAQYDRDYAAWRAAQARQHDDQYLAWRSRQPAAGARWRPG